jgi:predicted Zn-dependent protease
MRRIAPLLLLASAGLAGCIASTQEEVQLGASYAAQINSKLPLVQDPEVNAYINRLGDSLAKVADTRNLQWHFYVVDSKEVNAFAVPGGYVYVNRGLIERFGKLDELATTMGHEIGHVTQRHTMKQQQKSQGIGIGATLACVLTRVCNTPGVGDLVNLGAGAAMAGFSREDEAESDRMGIAFALRAGIDPRGMIRTFEILLAERKAKPDGLDAMFMTHPLEEARIQQAREVIAQIPASQLVGLTEDTQAFQRFKAKVKSLPPSPAGSR